MDRRFKKPVQMQHVTLITDRIIQLSTINTTTTLFSCDLKEEKRFLPQNGTSAVQSPLSVHSL